MADKYSLFGSCGQGYRAAFDISILEVTDHLVLGMAEHEEVGRFDEHLLSPQFDMRTGKPLGVHVPGAVSGSGYSFLVSIGDYLVYDESQGGKCVQHTKETLKERYRLDLDEASLDDRWWSEYQAACAWNDENDRDAKEPTTLTRYNPYT